MGAVSITTKLGQGTIVRVYLPRTTAQAVLHASGRREDDSLPRHEATILVADDDRDVRRVAVSCLENLGYRVLAAKTGQAALDKIANGADVDLVLIDIATPEINDVGAMAAILDKRPRLPFLYMTDYVGPTKLDLPEQRVIKNPSR